MVERRQVDDAPSNHALDKRLILMEAALIRLEKDMQDIRRILLAIAGTLGLGLLGAVVNWVVKGGLSG